MADNDPGNDPVDRALRLFVYGPVGLACYLRDSAPTFMEVFVSRGKREVDGARRTVEEKLGFAKPEPEPSPSTQQRVADGLGKVASQTSSVLAAMAGPLMNAATSAASTAATAAAPANGTAPAPGDAPRPEGIPSVGNPNTAVRGAAAAANGAAADLPISGYDLLSASQVIERLEGLSRGALERIRVYELAHRARRTILASIDQLTG
ncbi:MAG: hypothetical protein WDA60_11455 [Acidimicrobiia bacterium]